MEEYLKEYTVELETIGPAFIGSGREISKKEYILRANEMYVIDIPLLYDFARNHRLADKLENFFLNENKKDLFYFLKENDLSLKDIEGCIKYSLPVSDTSLARGTKVTVMEFVRDAYGMPYVPGSSIKGMLRTILLAADIIENNSDYRSEKYSFDEALQRGGKRNTLLKNDMRKLEAKRFNTLTRSDRKSDAVNDILSGMRISDSRPLDNGDIILCQRTEYHKDGTEKRLNVLRECIKPGTKIYFNLTIDEMLCSYSTDDILHAIAVFSDMYNKVFRTKFSKIASSGKDSIYLGGGVGFVSKTIIYALYGDSAGLDRTIDIFYKTKVPNNHKHNLDRQLGVSPHILKTTYYKGKMYQMGECRWRLC